MSGNLVSLMGCSSGGKGGYVSEYVPPNFRDLIIPKINHAGFCAKCYTHFQRKPKNDVCPFCHTVGSFRTVTGKKTKKRGKPKS